MKVSTAALSFLILGAALGSQARIVHNRETRELQKAERELEPPTLHLAAARDVSDCCFSYTSRRLRCSNFVGYFLTSGACIQPGVIFFTNTGKRVCAKPSNLSIQKCMSGMSSRSKDTQNI